METIHAWPLQTRYLASLMTPELTPYGSQMRGLCVPLTLSRDIPMAPFIHNGRLWRYNPLLPPQNGLPCPSIPSIPGISAPLLQSSQVVLALKCITTRRGGTIT